MRMKKIKISTLSFLVWIPTSLCSFDHPRGFVKATHTNFNWISDSWSEGKTDQAETVDTSLTLGGIYSPKLLSAPSRPLALTLLPFGENEGQVEAPHWFYPRKTLAPKERNFFIGENSGDQRLISGWVTRPISTPPTFSSKDHSGENVNKGRAENIDLPNKGKIPTATENNVVTIGNPGDHQSGIKTAITPFDLRQNPLTNKNVNPSKKRKFEEAVAPAHQDTPVTTRRNQRNHIYHRVKMPAALGEEILDAEKVPKDDRREHEKHIFPIDSFKYYCGNMRNRWLKEKIEAVGHSNQINVDFLRRRLRRSSIYFCHESIGTGILDHLNDHLNIPKIGSLILRKYKKFLAAHTIKALATDIQLANTIFEPPLYHNEIQLAEALRAAVLELQNFWNEYGASGSGTFQTFRWFSQKDKDYMRYLIDKKHEGAAIFNQTSRGFFKIWMKNKFPELFKQICEHDAQDQPLLKFLPWFIVCFNDRLLSLDWTERIKNDSNYSK